MSNPTPVPPQQFYASSSRSKQPKPPTTPATPPRGPLALDPSLVANGTPISLKTSNAFPHSSGHPVTVPAQREMAADLHMKSVGPMEVEQFLKKFLPFRSDHAMPPPLPLQPVTAVANSMELKSPSGNSSADPLTLRAGLDQPKKACGFNFDDVSAASTESLMYDPFVQTCRKITSKLDFVDSSDHGDPECKLGGTGLKPDVIVYAPHSGRTRESDFSRIEMHIEFKHDSHDDPFQDPRNAGPAKRPLQSFENTNSQMAIDTYGQITSYASAQMCRQFRTHCFSVLVAGNHARLFRWDHAGVVATVAFDHVSSPHLFVNFFRRYAQASDAVRGRDQTVRNATLEEQRAAEEHLGHSDRYFAIEVAVPFTDPVTKETIAVRTLIVAAPRYSTHSLLGRSTRGMVAFDMTSKQKVFLKDTWRIDSPEFAQEGETYKILQAAKVKNIARFIGACDVSDAEGVAHATLTQVYARMPWACETDYVIGYRHYRLMLDTVGVPIWTFESSYQLISAVWDAIEGHKDAYEAGILHRDISVGNILIGPDGRGLLIDWDFAKGVTELSMPGRRRERTGTWQFCSAAMLLYPGTHRHVLADDLESFVYVVSWLALRYCRHNLSATTLGNVLYDNFDQGVRQQGKDRGGSGKAATLNRGEFTPPAFFDIEPLDYLLPTLFTTFSVRYDKALSEASFRANKFAKARPDPTRIVHDVDRERRAMRLERIESHEWILYEGRFVLSDTGSWPLDDRAEAQPFVAQEPAAGKRPSNRERAKNPAKRSRYENSLSLDDAGGRWPTTS
ncbi:hypothetical protein BV25DRAFT_1920545 [Artomyces pyxidatus]|uniref:Uncharacterized protein n=1 Tax=Artomyces pyxidatus TaxID=48021 RepID=A0ACB8SLD5_9AGAM|nr:hypothetical protein BV25DRAFT_1920545 [Artomyces pyxidatus]